MTISRVQGSTSELASSANPTVTYGSAVAAHNTLVARICVFTAGVTITASGVTDSVNSGTWSIAGVQTADTGGGHIYIVFFQNTAAGTPTLTIHFSSATVCDVEISEWSGVTSIGQFYKNNGTTGTSMPTPAMMLEHVPAAVVVANNCGQTWSAAGSGYTGEGSPTTSGNGFEFAIFTSGGGTTTTCTATQNISAAWANAALVMYGLGSLAEVPDPGPAPPRRTLSTEDAAAVLSRVSAAAALATVGWQDDVVTRAMRVKAQDFEVGPVDKTVPYVSTSDVASSYPDQPWHPYKNPPPIPEAWHPDATKPNLGSSWGFLDDSPQPLVTRARPAVLAEPWNIDATKPNLGSSWGVFPDEPIARVTKARPAVLPEPWHPDATKPNLGSSWGAFSDDPQPLATKARPQVLAEPMPLDATKPNLGTSWGVFADDVVALVVRARPRATEENVPPRFSQPALANSGWWDGANWLPAKPPKPIPEGPWFDAATIIVLPKAGWMADEVPRRAARARALDEATVGSALAPVLARLLFTDEPLRASRASRPGLDEGGPLAPRLFPLAPLTVLADEIRTSRRAARSLEEWLPLHPWQSGLSFLGVDEPVRTVALRAALALELPLAALGGHSFGWVADDPAIRARPTRRWLREEPLLRPVTVIVLPSWGWVPDVVPARARAPRWPIEDLAFGVSVIPGPVRTILREIVVTGVYLREQISTTLVLHEQLAQTNVLKES